MNMTPSTLESGPQTSVPGHFADVSKGRPVKVDVRNVNFSYGTSNALKGISLPHGPNEVTAFIGQSRSGKSSPRLSKSSTGFHCRI